MEARAATSNKAYIYKMQVCEGELRESLYWIRVATESGFTNADYAAMGSECNELIAIVVTCIKKAKARPS
jgi:four helix bundle protein